MKNPLFNSLVWDSLRLAPIKTVYVTYLSWKYRTIGISFWLSLIVHTSITTPQDAHKTLVLQVYLC